MAVKIYRKDSFKGTIQLRSKNASTLVYSPFTIPPGSTVEMLFPGESGSPVMLSTSNVDEVEVISTAASTITYLGSPAKSELMKVGKKQSIDVVVTDPDGIVTTCEFFQILEVADRAND